MYHECHSEEKYREETSATWEAISCEYEDFESALSRVVTQVWPKLSHSERRSQQWDV